MTPSASRAALSRGTPAEAQCRVARLRLPRRCESDQRCSSKKRLSSRGRFLERFASQPPTSSKCVSGCEPLQQTENQTRSKSPAPQQTAASDFVESQTAPATIPETASTTSELEWPEPASPTETAGTTKPYHRSQSNRRLTEHAGFEVSRSNRRSESFRNELCLCFDKSVTK